MHCKSPQVGIKRQQSHETSHLFLAAGAQRRSGQMTVPSRNKMSSHIPLLSGAFAVCEAAGTEYPKRGLPLDQLWLFCPTKRRRLFDDMIFDIES